jgi:hypothetical protein
VLRNRDKLGSAWAKNTEKDHARFCVTPRDVVTKDLSFLHTDAEVSNKGKPLCAILGGRHHATVSPWAKSNPRWISSPRIGNLNMPARFE